ncbi:hypothetical protein KP509_19G003300 [Ceratopteris richardii]|uniref:Uncharacterized protein n=1 Tax=Ceratopteris richardii TaxID=49495 RepID=A0A8T2SKQ1_CERRI|nr:hypothetical protein KP509_19G003300 [Ceratopteris richardii]
MHLRILPCAIPFATSSVDSIVTGKMLLSLSLASCCTMNHPPPINSIVRYSSPLAAVQGLFSTWSEILLASKSRHANVLGTSTRLTQTLPMSHPFGAAHIGNRSDMFF